MKRAIPTSPWRLKTKTGIAFSICALLLASCGGGNEAAPPHPSPPPTQPEPPVAPPPPPPPQAKCTIDTTVAASHEEQRLVNKLASSDAMSFSEQLLAASGFDKFGPEFSLKLCTDGLSGASTYDDAVKLLHTEGQKLWQAAVDRVQGRKVEGTLSKSDDRMLYWARLTMTLALRQWKPDFPLSDEQRAALQHEFERASRGQYAIDFPEGAGHKRILVSGFDPFTLGTPGVHGNLNIRIGNPSGATILSLDGHTVALADGTTAVIRTFILPVSYGPFIQGMQEDTLGPWFKSGPKRVDASISMSQGGGTFDLEHFNGRYHFANFVGNDDLHPPCMEASGSTGGSTVYPAALDCDIHPPERWLGFASKPWRRDAPPQFTQASLPFQKMIDANTGAGIVNPSTGIAEGWIVANNYSYSVTICTKAADDQIIARAVAQTNLEEALSAYFAALDVSAEEADAALQKYFEAINALGATGDPSPLETNCALSGSGGTYLSNASAYRNTLLRDIFRLNIPAGHIHTPAMTVFGPDSNDKITDATLEARRDAIVAQSRNLVFAVAKTLAASTAP